MEAYQQRVVQEKSDLDEKVKKLEVFLNGAFNNGINVSKTTDEELARMSAQLGYMKAYSIILGDRIKNF